MKLIKLEEVAGRTVKALVLGDCESQVVITFTDDTYIYLSSQHYDRDDPARLSWDYLDEHEFGDDALILAGLTTAEEVARRKAEEFERALRVAEDGRVRQLRTTAALRDQYGKSVICSNCGHGYLSGPMDMCPRCDQHNWTP